MNSPRTGQDEADWLAIVCVFSLAQFIARPGNVKAFSRTPFGFFLRISWIYFTAIQVFSLILYMLNQTADVQKVMAIIGPASWMAVEYFALCREPPPRARMAFAGGVA